MTQRWVCLDIGETLVDETRVWACWAAELRIPSFTLAAVMGGLVARGEAHEEAFALLGLPGWRSHARAVEARYGGFREDDLYPDARRCVASLRASGYRVAITGNQPAARTAELRALGVQADVVAMSDEIGAEKPSSAFFEAVLRRTGCPEQSAVAYVGDRIDNDVVPAAAAGMRTVWLRRGPWAFLQQPPAERPPHLVVASLDELTLRIGEAWP